MRIADHIWGIQICYPHGGNERHIQGSTPHSGEREGALALQARPPKNASIPAFGGVIHGVGGDPQGYHQTAENVF